MDPLPIYYTDKEKVMLEKQKSPMVEVRIPKINLHLSDLVYMRSLASADGVHCAIKNSQLDRLKILGLVELKQVPPPEEKLKKLQNEFQKLDDRMEALAAEKDWSGVKNLEWKWSDCKDAMKSEPKYVLTATGALLLEKGEVRVRIKKGCA